MYVHSLFVYVHFLFVYVRCIIHTKFFPSVCFYSDLPPVAYQQFLLPVVVIRIVTKIAMYLYHNACTYVHLHNYVHVYARQHQEQLCIVDYSH